jgi:hypothetical protein
LARSGWRAESVALKDRLGFRRFKKVDEVLRVLILAAPLGNDGCLIERRIGRDRHDPPGSEVFGPDEERKGDQSGLSIARIDKLDGLRDVFSKHQFLRDSIIDSG